MDDLDVPQILPWTTLATDSITAAIECPEWTVEVARELLANPDTPAGTLREIAEWAVTQLEGRGRQARRESVMRALGGPANIPPERVGRYQYGPMGFTYTPKDGLVHHANQHGTRKGHGAPVPIKPSPAVMRQYALWLWECADHRDLILGTGTRPVKRRAA